MDLTVDALPAVHGEFGAAQLVMRPDDANTLRQVRQDARHLAWKRPMQARRHQPGPPNSLPANSRVLCNDFGCLLEGPAAPTCAGIRSMVGQMESASASNTCGVAKPAAGSAHRPDLATGHIGLASIGTTSSGRPASTSESSSRLASNSSSCRVRVTGLAIPSSFANRNFSAG
jgi:hypothetical protein